MVKVGRMSRRKRRQIKQQLIILPDLALLGCKFIFALYPVCNPAYVHCTRLNKEDFVYILSQLSDRIPIWFAGSPLLLEVRQFQESG